MNSTFYFVVGELNVKFPGWNFDKNKKFLKIHAQTYNDAYKIAYKYAVSTFGEPIEEKYECVNINSWNLEPSTKKLCEKQTDSFIEFGCEPVIETISNNVLESEIDVCLTDTDNKFFG